MSDNVNHPKHYENGPFECIELTRLLSFDWGNVAKYCYRWQSKNGVEDLRKALWYANDAVIHGIPLYADTICPACAMHCSPPSWTPIGRDLEAFGGHSRTTVRNGKF